MGGRLKINKSGCRWVIAIDDWKVFFASQAAVCFFVDACVKRGGHRDVVFGAHSLLRDFRFGIRQFDGRTAAVWDAFKANGLTGLGYPPCSARTQVLADATN